jgi:hypothetical protein
MKTSLFSFACVVVVVTFAMASDEALGAGPNSGGSGSRGSHGSYRSFSSHGRSFSSHTYGSSYRGWSRYCWFPGYSCYGYYSPTDYCWYYYSATYSCYLPVTYMSTIAPAVNTNTNTNTNTNVNTNVNVNANGLPAGATALAAGFVPNQPSLPK